MEENKVYDAAIIGMGPAGISASIYLKRGGISPLCFEMGEVGGTLNKLEKIENYPSFIGSGKELASLMKKQLEHFDINVIKQQVVSINDNFDGTYLIRTVGSTYLVKGVIVASGIKQNPITIPGANKYNQSGISRCAECDGPFSKNKPVAVFSSNSNGAKEAMYLATICSSVYFINPEQDITGDQDIVNKLKQLPNVKIFNNTKIKDTNGSRKIEKVILSSGEELDINALFIFIGATPITEFLGYMDITDKFGQIKTDEKMQTSQKGIFACGDDRLTLLRQVISAVSDGGIAAVSLRNYLRNNGK